MIVEGTLMAKRTQKIVGEVKSHWDFFNTRGEQSS